MNGPGGMPAGGQGQERRKGAAFPQPPDPPAAVPQPPAVPASPGRRTVIPLMPGTPRPTGERRAVMAEAVMEVVRHLVLRAVPPEQRSPLFGQAADLLSEAGWGLDELFEAARGGPARSALFRALGLET